MANKWMSDGFDGNFLFIFIISILFHAQNTVKKPKFKITDNYYILKIHFIHSLYSLPQLLNSQ